MYSSFSIVMLHDHPQTATFDMSMSVDKIMLNVNTHKEQGEVINAGYPVVQKIGHCVLLCLPKESRCV